VHQTQEARRHCQQLMRFRQCLVKDDAGAMTRTGHVASDCANCFSVIFLQHHLHEVPVIAGPCLGHELPESMGPATDHDGGQVTLGRHMSWEGWFYRSSRKRPINRVATTDSWAPWPLNYEYMAWVIRFRPAKW